MLFCCAYLLSHVWLFAAPWTVACQAPPSMGDSPGKNTGVGCHALFQGILPTWGSNSGLPHCRQILYHLSHQRSPRIWERVAYPFSRGSSQSRNRTGVSCIAGESFTSWATREAVSGSYGHSSFIFVWNFHTIFHSSCTNLHSHQQCKVSFASTFWPTFVIFGVLMITILKGVKCYLIVVLIFISLMTSYANTLGACLPSVGPPEWRDTHEIQNSHSCGRTSSI